MKEQASQKKERTWKREIAEWAVMLAIGFFIYAMGWHTEILGRAQQAVLWTGIIQPETELTETERKKIDFDMPLISLSGERTNLSAFKGEVIFINFWATWCPPCIAEMPNIQALYEQYKDKPEIRFVMISLDEEPEKAKKFLNSKAFTFTSYIPVGRRPEVFQSGVIPTTYVLDKNGRLASKKEGMANYNTSAFKNFLDALLNE